MPVNLLNENSAVVQGRAEEGGEGELTAPFEICNCRLSMLAGSVAVTLQTSLNPLLHGGRVDRSAQLEDSSLICSAQCLYKQLSLLPALLVLVALQLVGSQIEPTCRAAVACMSPTTALVHVSGPICGRKQPPSPLECRWCCCFSATRSGVGVLRCIAIGGIPPPFTTNFGGVQSSLLAPAPPPPLRPVCITPAVEFVCRYPCIYS